MWNMDPTALLTPNHTPDRNSMTTYFAQPSTQPPKTDVYPLVYPLGPLDGRRKGLRVSFAFFPKNQLPAAKLIEAVATVEQLSDRWKLGAMIGVLPFVMNCYRRCLLLFVLVVSIPSLACPMIFAF